MKKNIFIFTSTSILIFILLIVLIVLKYCNSFERKFYNSLKQGQINAIKNGADIFDFSTITNFEWDSVTDRKSVV